MRRLIKWIVNRFKPKKKWYNAELVQSTMTNMRSPRPDVVHSYITSSDWELNIDQSSTTSDDHNVEYVIKRDDSYYHDIYNTGVKPDKWDLVKVDMIRS